MGVRRTMQRAVPWLAVAFAAATLYDAYSWLIAASINRAIVDGSIVTRTGKLPLEAVFAKAYWEGRASNDEAALALYRDTAEQSTGALERSALYNTGNIYEREARRLHAEGKEDLARPFIELAKQSYRDVLHADPGYWDAKYNLERALRLAPDDEEDGVAPPPVPRERAPTTMRGSTLGYP